MTLTDAELTFPPAGASAEVARRLAPHLAPHGTERRIRVDQTNRSVVVDEAVIVKWFTPPAPEPHHGLTVIEHLTGVGFTDMPTWLGAERDDHHVLAIASEYVHGALDGWDWFVAVLVPPEAGAGGPIQADEWAQRMARLAASMHVALATPSSKLATSALADRDHVRREGERLLDHALSDVTDHAARRVLTGAEQAIRDQFASVVPGPTPTTPIHGDLHVGQVLLAGDRLFITDFDGNPLLDPADRARPRPAALDVAGLLQSFDHAARIVQKRTPGGLTGVVELMPRLIDNALTAYQDQLATLGRGELLDVALLPSLRVAQELHDLIYAARHLPRWTYAPAAALAAMFDVEYEIQPEPTGGT
jgi:maltokinase